MRNLPGTLSCALYRAKRRFIMISEQLGIPCFQRKLFHHFKNQALRILRKLSNSSVTPFHDLVLAAWNTINADNKLSDTFFDAIIAGSPTETRFFDQALKRNNRSTQPQENFVPIPLATIKSKAAPTPSRFRSSSSLHIIIDNEASLKPILLNPDFQDVNIIVYGFIDRKNEMLSIETNNRVQLVSIRELFPDLSKEAEALRQQCRDHAKSIFSELTIQAPEQTKFIQANRSVLELALEDDLNHQLTLARCIVQAAKNIPNGESVIVAIGNADVLPTLLPELEEIIGSEHLHILYANGAKKRSRRFWQTIRTKYFGERTFSESANAVLPTVSREKRWREVGDDLADALLAKTGNTERNQYNKLLVFDPISPPYVSAVEEMLAEANRANASVLALSLQNFLWRNDKEIFSGGLNQNITYQHLNLNHPSLDDDEASFQIYFSYGVGRSDHTAGLSVSDRALCGHETVLFFTTKFSKFIALEAFSRRLLSAFKGHTILTTAGRSWRIRMFASIAMNASDTKVVDFQILNLLPQKKYVAPIAHKVCVLDEASFKLHRDFLGIDESKLTITGSPSDSAFINAQLDRDVSSQAAVPNQHILFASQLQPWERISPVLESLVKFAVEQAKPLVIKLHPRETSARYTEYNDFLVNSELERIHIIEGDYPLKAVLKKTTVCVTLFSNAGRQASLSGIPVICGFLSDWRPPKRLDLEGIAQAATSESDLFSLLDEIFAKVDGSATPKQIQSRQPVNAARNVFQVAEDIGDRDLKPATSEVVVLLESKKFYSNAVSLLNGLEGTAIEIHCPDVLRDGKSLSGNDIRFFHGEYSAENEALFARAVERAEYLSESIASSFAIPQDQAVNELKRYAPAIAQHFRSILIAPVKRHGIIKRASKKSLSDKTVLAIGASDSFFHSVQEVFSQSAQQGNRPAKTTAFDASKHRHWTIPLNAPSQTDSFLQFILKQASIAPVKLDATIVPAKATSTSRKTLVLSTAWGLKTVPPTVSPLLRLYAEDGYDFLVMNYSLSGKKALEAELELLGCSYQLYSLNDLSPPKTTGAPYTTPLLSPCDLSIEGEALRQSVSQFLSTQYHQLLNWADLCNDAFVSSAAISMACPGRQWHADLAHVIASAHNAPTVTVQNAYMFKGYTYAPPTGDIITAIDSEQRDVFVNDFGISTSNIAICGSPRFDALALEKPTLNNNRSVGKLTKPTVLFAAQAGLEDIAIRAVNAILKASVNPTPTVTLKVHPRTTKEQLDRIYKGLEGFKSDTRLHIQLDGDLVTTLQSSDLVLTAYSNIGLEAAILGTPVIFTAYNKHFATLSSAGVGVIANDEAQTTKLVERVFDDSAFSTELAVQQRAFLNANPCLRDGTSAKTIKELMDEQLAAAMRSPERDQAEALPSSHRHQ